MFELTFGKFSINLYDKKANYKWWGYQAKGLLPYELGQNIYFLEAR